MVPTASSRALTFAFGPKQQTPTNVRFSNRPFGVKHFQTIHHGSV
jgi:hypothetical protein